MLRRGISIKSSTSTIRRFLDIMTSKAHDLQGSCKLQCNGIGLCQSGQCIKSLFIRTVSSCSTNSGPGKVTDESVDRKSKETAVLQWDKLSEDEKNIYFAHKSACMKGENSYADPVTGYSVFTEEFLMKRRSCCGNGCRHCPYGHENVPQSQRNKKFNSA